MHAWILRHVSFRGYLRIQIYQIKNSQQNELWHISTYVYICTTIYKCLQMMWQEEVATGDNKPGNKGISQPVILFLCSLKLWLQSSVFPFRS
jgi:hypothetical protein